MLPTDFAACSRHAGEWMFGKNSSFKIIHNAVDLSKYAFNQDVRDNIRNKLGINDKFVIGHIGRFCYQKNQEFLIDIFNEIHKSTDAVLLMIGSGKTESFIKSEIHKLGLDDKAIFIGNTLDVNEYYQAMDFFVLPSRVEGLGMVAVEAQVSGLPVICSTEVPDEVAITNLVTFCPLSEPASEWAKLILSHKVFERRDTTNEIRNAGYDITKEAKILENYYLNMIKGDL